MEPPSCFAFSPKRYLAVSNVVIIEGILSCPCIAAAMKFHSRHQIKHSISTSGPNVDKDLLKLTRRGAMLLFITALAGCSTPPAKNFGGPWKSVNHFQNRPTEIPLNPAYVFYASPMDETLKTMLARWARDSGRDLSYHLSFDVTLYQPVAGIHTADIDDAVARLNSIYAAQGVFVTANARRIEVGPPSTANANAISENSIHSTTKPATPSGAK
ncbi:hypothetical protein [Rhodanobacter geophilus]|uniref:Toxin co-regulated pilus biosynthesis protein Q C-terminal domain-containing protein n=1 Tax=Rhodanobacter geophilus TaxID=3162488 RepID=A0ABV3QSK7_9GAMM